MTAVIAVVAAIKLFKYFGSKMCVCVCECLPEWMTLNCTITQKCHLPNNMVLSCSLTMYQSSSPI